MEMSLVVIIGIAIAVLVSALIVKRIVPTTELGNWAHVATIIAGLATAIALPWAAYTFDESSRLQRELTAANLYQEHMKISVERPELANRRLMQGSQEEKDNERYMWYVGHALYSFETILEALPGDAAWEATAQAFIEDHRNYIGDSNFACKRYTQRIRLLVNKTLKREVCPTQP
jgi:hypothetical protein